MENTSTFTRLNTLRITEHSVMSRLRWGRGLFPVLSPIGWSLYVKTNNRLSCCDVLLRRGGVCVTFAARS